MLVLLLAIATPVGLLAHSVVSDDLFRFPRNLIASLPFAALLLGWALTPPRRGAAAAPVALAAAGICVGAVKTLEEEFQRPNFPAVAELLETRAGRRDRIGTYGPRLTAFETINHLRPYLPERQPIFGASTPAELARAVRAGGDGPGRVFLAELQDRSLEPLPRARGLRKVDDWFFPGIRGVVVGVYALP